MNFTEELFIVKDKSKYSCKSAIYFDLSPEIIKENCKFDFYYNKNHITPIALDGGNEIMLANWANNKHIICNKTMIFLSEYQAIPKYI